MGGGGCGRLCPGSALQARMVRVVRMDSVCIRLVRVILVQGTRLTPDGHSLFFPEGNSISVPRGWPGRTDGYMKWMLLFIITKRNDFMKWPQRPAEPSHTLPGMVRNDSGKGTE